MKTIIAGSRDITDPKILEMALIFSKMDITEVVCGGARGVDELGRLWAINYDIPITMFPAEWDKYGKSAGYRRNRDMAVYADALIAVWDGSSKGTKNMIDVARNKGLSVYVFGAFKNKK